MHDLEPIRARLSISLTEYGGIELGVDIVLTVHLRLEFLVTECGPRVRRRPFAYKTEQAR